MKGPIATFFDECDHEIKHMATDASFQDSTKAWMDKATAHKYSYHFTWLGRPIIQYPQDILAMQEIIWKVQPDLIIETGIAHGGSLIFYSSMLELLAACGGAEYAKVIAIDIDIREHNKQAILEHPLSRRVTMLQGSSVDPEIVRTVHELSQGSERILVCLDSNHTHEHVLQELKAYAPLVTKGSYCVVFDTIIERFTEEASSNRPWGKGDNPMTAVDAFLKDNTEFIRDEDLDAKLQISVAPRGYLQRR